MKNKIPYLRIGTVYYKQIEKPLISGDKNIVLSRWSRETIIHDHEKNYLSQIPKYDGFCCIPNHLHFQQIVDGFYNIYNEIPFQPSSEIDNLEKLKLLIPNSLEFMQHIFGSQIQLGLDYLKILFEFPTQILPILCLVSKERATGKSTFLKWLKEIFGMNMSYIKGDSFGSQFNSDWIAMLIVAIDEVFFDRKEITERLKYLSTTNKDKLENKGKDREEVDFFAKFVLCSNNEENFIQIDESEIRFWILKICPITAENTEFLNHLIEEIPFFLKFLLVRKFHSEKKTRMWFSPEEIKTDALQKLVWKNNNKLEGMMLETFYELFESLTEEEIQVVPQDVLSMVNKFFKTPNYSHYTRNDIRKILKDSWELIPQSNSLHYIKHGIDYSDQFYQENKIGRYFTISKSMILQKFDRMMK
jgi:hypothetical protein